MASDDVHSFDGKTESKHVFLSYVREDDARVTRIQLALEAQGLTVWRDVTDLWPGELWKTEIRNAIQVDSLAFVPCFSAESALRDTSMMYEELGWAAEQHRRVKPGLSWIFPVLLDDVGVPEIDLGMGQTLGDIQWAKLFENWDSETKRLVSAIQRVFPTAAAEPPKMDRSVGASPGMSLDDLGSASRTLASATLVEAQALMARWSDDVTFDSVWGLLEQAQSLGAIAASGVHVWLPGPVNERFLRMRAEQGPVERVAFDVETPEGTTEGKFDWSSGTSTIDALRGLFEMMKKTGAEWTAFDASWIFEQGLIPIRIGLGSKLRLPDVTTDMGPVIEVPADDWVITNDGLERVSRFYAIEWQRVWESDWIEHLSEKQWADPSDVARAVTRARQYFNRRLRENET